MDATYHNVIRVFSWIKYSNLGHTHKWHWLREQFIVPFNHISLIQWLFPIKQGIIELYIFIVWYLLPNLLLIHQMIMVLGCFFVGHVVGGYLICDLLIFTNNVNMDFLSKNVWYLIWSWIQSNNCMLPHL